MYLKVQRLYFYKAIQLYANDERFSFKVNM